MVTTVPWLLKIPISYLIRAWLLHLRVKIGADQGFLFNFQVDSKLIFYQHEMPDKPFWLAQDAIRFRVVTPTTISDSFILLVLISFEEKCPQRLTQLWKNAGKGRMEKYGTNQLFRRGCLSEENTTVLFSMTDVLHQTSKTASNSFFHHRIKLSPTLPS